MPRSRYADTTIIDDHHFASFKLPVRSAGYKEPDLLEGVRTFDHVIKRGERVDHLAAKFFGEESYWWIIALVNGINYPFASGGWIPGRVLKIPFNVTDVLEKLQA
jgi:hypothetical protein